MFLQWTNPHSKYSIGYQMLHTVCVNAVGFPWRRTVLTNRVRCQRNLPVLRQINEILQQKILTWILVYDARVRWNAISKMLILSMVYLHDLKSKFRQDSLLTEKASWIIIINFYHSYCLEFWLFLLRFVTDF